ncbi:MAG: pyruvate synthase subunit PorD [Coriobacteriia bacterium]
MKWDITRIDSWTADDFPRGAVIPEAGNSHYYVTGGWRSERPIRDLDKCTQCLICWIDCPDSAILVENEQLAEEAFDLDHCKGCGVCANVCPADAIRMENEQACLLGEVE